MASTPLHRGNPDSSPASIFSRPALFSAAKLLLFGLLNLPFLRAAPTRTPFSAWDKPEPLPSRSPQLWIYLTVAVGLVLLGGAFAGLTIALMGQDEIYLQVIEKSGEGHEKKHAASVLRLLKRGKHWVLVTLLLGNVITNETLPIVLDRSLGGGWPAVLGSTVLIVIFGEIIPQSICVRYGLPIGAWMSPLVLILMYILAPVAWPTAKLLDRLLGEDHGTTYKKAGLKTLVTLHKTLGAAGEQLNSDEVTIISAVLDLKAKPVGSIMTPMEDVFTMSADTVLDEKTTDIILRAGYSRIPIHTPNNPVNFVGMLLVKILITYDPEDCKRVRDFALATLPETRAETSCLDIVNFFQEGKSHMVLVSEFPGEDRGALGVVTLEDVIEELIGEEIIDESDVYIDVHRAIRRMAPAPKSRIPKGEVVDSTGKPTVGGDMNSIDAEDDKKAQHRSTRRIAMSDGGTSKENGAQHERDSSPRITPDIRRASSVAGGSDREGLLKRSNTADMREHLKHLGPSNLASRPRQTRYNAVKIKPGAGANSENPFKNQDVTSKSRTSSVPTAAQDGIRDGFISSGAKEAQDGVLAVLAGYGTITSTPNTPSKTPQSPPGERLASTASGPNSSDMEVQTPTLRPTANRTGSHSTLGSLNNGRTSRPATPKVKRSLTVSVARSGSITENIVEAGGIKKTVLEMSSSSEELGEQQGRSGDHTGGSEEKAAEGDRKENAGGENSSNRKKRRRRKRKGGADAKLVEEDEGGEGTPLLQGGSRAD